MRAEACAALCGKTGVFSPRNTAKQHDSAKHVSLALTKASKSVYAPKNTEKAFRFYLLFQEMCGCRSRHNL